MRRHSTNSTDLEELVAYRGAQRRYRIKILAVVLAVVGVASLLPLPFGGGLFGYRLFRYDRVHLYVANGLSEPITVDLSSGPATDFGASDVGHLMFRAGEVELVAYREDGSVLESLEFYTDNASVFYSPGGAMCFAVMDISPMYRGAGQPEPIVFIDGVNSDDRLFNLPEGTFVAPRGTAPDAVPSGTQVTWIDDVACQLLDEQNREVLLAQQRLRMRERMERRRQLLEESEGPP